MKWREIEEYCKIIAEKIIKRNLKFDAVVGVVRGGVIPARILSDYLSNDNLHFIRAKFYEDIGKTAKKPKIIYSTCKRGNFLIVDDVADTGKTLKEIVDYFKKKGSNVFTVTLFKKPTSIFEPDLFVKETDKWIIFPWEKLETEKSIKNKG